MNPPPGRKRARVESHDRGQSAHGQSSWQLDGHDELQSATTLKSAPSPEQASDPYAYALPPLQGSPISTSGPKASAASSASSSAFRNVSACNRCRLRKNRCDQNLPSCSACEKAGVKCVGFDPITKREIPRSYVYFLESRTTYLEALLQEHGIPYSPSDSLAVEGRASSLLQPGADTQRTQQPSAVGGDYNQSSQQTQDEALAVAKQEEDRQIDKLVSNVGLVSVQGASGKSPWKSSHCELPLTYL